MKKTSSLYLYTNVNTLEMPNSKVSTKENKELRPRSALIKQPLFKVFRYNSYQTKYPAFRLKHCLRE